MFQCSSWWYLHLIPAFPAYHLHLTQSLQPTRCEWSACCGNAEHTPVFQMRPVTHWGLKQLKTPDQTSRMVQTSASSAQSCSSSGITARTLIWVRCKSLNTVGEKCGGLVPNVQMAHPLVWEARTADRTRRPGCPFCASRRLCQYTSLGIKDCCC